MTRKKGNPREEKQTLTNRKGETSGAATSRKAEKRGVVRGQQHHPHIGNTKRRMISWGGWIN